MTSRVEKLHQHALQAEAVWSKSYGVFDEVIRARQLRVGAEIGVAFGGHVEALLSVPTVERMYGIDAYRHTATSYTLGLSQSEFDDLYTYVLKRLARFGDRYKHIREWSVDALDSIPGQIDFAYIDANHSYEAVLEDLCAWFPKVCEGGLVGGHDYAHPGLSGVKRAVDRFFGRFGWHVHVEREYVWWIEKKTPSISFIMPAYNCAGTIEESVGSILAENFEDDDELIIVDDGSTDNTDSVLRELRSKHLSIRLLKHDENRGASAARNTAISNAKNPLLFNLDSDNILVPGSISKLRAYLISSDADVAAFGEMRFFSSGTGKVTHHWIFEPGLLTLAAYLSGARNPGGGGNYMFTKGSWDKAGGYPEFAKTYETWGFALRQLATGSKMVVMPESFYLHRYGHRSLWVREGGKKNASLKTLEMLLPFLDLLVPEDVEYILSHKEHWYTDLRKHPIRVKGQA